MVLVINLRGINVVYYIYGNPLGAANIENHLVAECTN
jgi:hypothetical protein